MKQLEKNPFYKKKNSFKLRISITDICNLKCKHCFAKAHAEHMDFELFKKTIDNLYDIYKENSVISYMGGEPMLYPKVVESVKYITNKNMKVSFTTNGYKVDKNKLKEIKNAGEVVLSVSLDGPEEFHNQNRGKQDSFREAIKTIDFIAKIQETIFISIPFFKQSVDFFDFFDYLLKKYNCILRFSRFVAVGRGSKISDDMAGRNDYKKLFQYADFWNKNGPKNIRIDIVDPFFKHPGKGMRSCNCGKTLAFVNTNGEVWPCWRMQLPIGDLKKEHLKKILENPIIDDYLDESKLKGKCAICKNKPICKGGCHAVPFTIYGDYHLEDPQCPFFSKVPIYS